LVREGDGKRWTGTIIEVESYIGEDDPASHARVGRTKRTSVMYGEAGHAYIYLIYGMYFCLNIVTEQQGFPAAILIRGVRVLEDPLDLRRKSGKSAEILDGPGKVCRFYCLTGAWNEADMTTRKGGLWVEDGDKLPYIATPRTGIKHGTEKLWRFLASPLR